jgi:hypothetical protein
VKHFGYPAPGDEERFWREKALIVLGAPVDMAVRGARNLVRYRLIKRRLLLDSKRAQVAKDCPEAESSLAPGAPSSWK